MFRIPESLGHNPHVLGAISQLAQDLRDLPFLDCKPALAISDTCGDGDV
jgi:hypothetical protein